MGRAGRVRAKVAVMQVDSTERDDVARSARGARQHAAGVAGSARRHLLHGARDLADDPRRRAVVLVAIVIDGLVLLGALGRWVGVEWLADDRWSLAGDRRVGELWLDVKLLGSAALLVSAASRRRPILAAVAATLAMFVVDDLGQGHERIGYQLATRLQLPAVATLRPDDLGELMAFAGYAVVVLGALALTWRASDRVGHLGALGVVAAMAATAVFAVVVDLIHSDRELDGWRAVLFDGIGVVEDAGEILGGTLVVAAALMAATAAARCRGTARRT